MARQKTARKRSLHIVNEHFEHLFNAVSAALGTNQSFLSKTFVLYAHVFHRYSRIPI
jgi:hypothetical protein